MEVDFQKAFEDSPIAQVISHDRIAIACNRAFLEMFRGTRADIVGKGFENIYPSMDHYRSTGDRVGILLARCDVFSEDRIMRRLDGELFWVHIRGLSYTPDTPHLRTLWAYAEIPTRNGRSGATGEVLTPRERDVAALLIEGRTGKEIARALAISPRTVDIYRSRLLRKYDVSSTTSLVQRLLTG